jgi:glycosyltransferase involved in cell wall biosynthesis
MRMGDVHGIRVIEVDLAYSNHDSLLKRSWIFFRFALVSIRLALTERYDLLFATSTPLTVALPGIVAKVLKRRTFIFEVRDLWPELPRAMGVIRNRGLLLALTLLEWLAYRLADSCIGLSPGIVEGIRKRSPKGRPIAMIPNGADLDIFSPDKSHQMNVEGIKPDDFVAVFCGAHGIANGLDAVLDAAAVLKSRHENSIKLLFVGDGKLKPALQERARDTELDNCLFLDSIPKHDLAELLASADVGLMILANCPAFYYGTSPNKFFDYISSGLPILNNYPGWLASLIAEHECGAVVDPGDAEAFADALTAMRNAPGQLQQMRENARQLAEQSFSRATLASQFVDFLEDTSDSQPTAVGHTSQADEPTAQCVSAISP